MAPRRRLTIRQIATLTLATPTYPFSPALNLFPTNSWGDPNTIDDPTSPRQSWQDPAAAAAYAANPTAVMTYNYWNQNTGQQVSFQVPAAQAMRANVPGVYQAYVIAPTPAMASYNAFPMIKPTPLDPGVLSSAQDAANLAATFQALIGGPVTIVDMTPSGVTITWNGETRRWNGLQFPGMLPNVGPLNCGKLLQQEYANGVGAPGKWSFSGSTDIAIWTTTVIPPGQPAPFPPTPMPQRNLLPGEQVISENVAGIPYFLVANTNNGYTPGVASAATSQGSGFTNADRALLTAIYNGLKAVNLISSGS